MHYNDWIERLLARRKTAQVTFSTHALDRCAYWNLDIEMVEAAVRQGSLVAAKCEPPGKLCFSLYDGKERCSYVVVALFHQEFIEVRTAWQEQGRYDATARA